MLLTFNIEQTLLGLKYVPDDKFAKDYLETLTKLRDKLVAAYKEE